MKTRWRCHEGTDAVGASIASDPHAARAPRTHRARRKDEKRTGTKPEPLVPAPRVCDATISWNAQL